MKRTHLRGLATLTGGLALALLVATVAQAVTTSGNVISTNPSTNLVTIETDDGQRFSIQSNDTTTFQHEGATMKLGDLQPGARITVTSSEPASLGGALAATHVEIDQMAAAAPVVVAAAEYPEPYEADRLPSTATPLPFVALAGTASILAGIGLRLRRRQG